MMFCITITVREEKGPGLSEILSSVFFHGVSLHDLPMIGAAKGYLEGMYQQAQGVSMLGIALPVMREAMKPQGPQLIHYPLLHSRSLKRTRKVR